eukprot:CAMPEP_0197521234 /NCGR_PEP_ID=MMETSP1318-20131121/6517_1 /TAXON_ID=552666 /ORGANISM="Partenskyella glossopodia, Strain RCC365" /LENGTH=543 /DNA_ID=CAMNT_0043073125 /DNA_START=335 /DNA_END=1966 /DNA_ORIENTATION=-
MGGMRKWERRLRDYSRTWGVRRSPLESEQQCMDIMKGSNTLKHDSEFIPRRIQIPTFYRRKKRKECPDAVGSVSVSDGARSQAVMRHTTLTPNLKTVESLKKALGVHAQSNINDLKELHRQVEKIKTERCEYASWLDYDDYVQVRSKCGRWMSSVLSTNLFLKMPKNGAGQVNIDYIVYFVMRHHMMRSGYLSILNHSIHLSKKSSRITQPENYKMLQYPQLKAWIEHQAKQMPQVRSANMMLAEVYATCAARKFFFFLDSHRSGSIPLTKLVRSSHFAHFQQIQAQQARTQGTFATHSNNMLDNNSSAFEVCGGHDNRFGAGDDLSSSSSSCSFIGGGFDVNAINQDPTFWFEPKTALRVFGIFLKLDASNRNRLTKADFSNWNNGSLSSLFVEQLWQVADLEVIAADSDGDDARSTRKEMGFETYLDFSIAMSHRNTPQGLRYLWGVLDTEQLGFLSRFHVQRLMDSIMDKLRSQGKRLLEKKIGVVQEIFDMARPKDAGKIDLQDLLDSGQGGLIVSIIIDAVRFWQYEHREHILAGQNP